MGRPRIVKKFSKTVDTNQGKLGGNKTDYRSTFVEHKDFSPRKNLKPPPTPPRPRFPAMESETTAQNSYIAKDVSSKREMIKPVEEQVISDEPLSSVTEYRNEFPAKPVLPAILFRPKTDADFESSQVKFDGRTTNKQFYQDWKPKMRKRFGEFPAFTGPLIYPDKRAMMEDPDVFKSRSQIDFPYKTIPKPEMVKAVEPNIKVGEGERNLQTTHRSAYQFTPTQATRALSMKPTGKSKSAAIRAMELTTKYQADFPNRKKYPMPPKASTPAPDTLEIKMNDDCVFETEQRKQYHGWDVKKFPRPDPSKIQDNTEISNEPMQTKTIMARDFTPKEISLERPGPSDRPQTNQSEFRGKFQGTTTNKSFYKDWSPKARPRFGDFHETYKQIYIPAYLKPPFNHSTTTQSTFVEKSGRPRTSMKPATNTIDQTQQHDFKTVSSMCYKYPPESAYEVEDFVIKC